MAWVTRRRRVRGARLAGAAVAVVAAAAVAAIGFGGGGDNGGTMATNLPPATAKVTRATLTRTEQVTGTLSYGTPRELIATASSGTVTWLPAPGSTIQLGQPVYQVDGEPVVLIHGTVPPYRPLAPGVKGVDVKQFEQSLKALGYKGFTVDDKFDWATASAVKKWQDKLGVEKTGTVAKEQIYAAPGDIRVALLAAVPGISLGPANYTLYTYSGTTRVVAIALDVAKQHLVKPGISATVTLPDNKKVEGTVASVDTVAKPPADGAQEKSTTIGVTVSISDQAALGTLDAAPVSVTLVAGKREGVLTVPITALVALSGGGYGVQVVEGSSTRYVTVKTGMFAGGKVEVSGDGVAEGTTVGVPTS